MATTIGFIFISKKIPVLTTKQLNNKILMKTRKITVYVDSDLDVDVGDVLDQLTQEELIGELIRRGKLNAKNITNLSVFIREILLNDGIQTSVYDEMKFDVLKEAFNKFNLEELERRLK